MFEFEFEVGESKFEELTKYSLKMAAMLSEYELARLENIKKNEEFLKSLGLYKDPNTSNAFDETEKKKKADGNKHARINRKKALKDADQVAQDALLVTRRSTRHQSANAASSGDQLTSLSDNEKDGSTSIHVKQKRYSGNDDAAAFFESLKKKVKRESEDGVEGDSGEEESEEDEDRTIISPEELRAYVEQKNPQHCKLISDKVCVLINIYTCM